MATVERKRKKSRYDTQEIGLHRIEIDRNKLLGTGTFAKVYQGTYKDDEGVIHDVAVKRIELEKKILNREAKLQIQFNNPNVLKMYIVETDIDFM